jgi:hypothetical protein
MKLIAAGLLVVWFLLAVMGFLVNGLTWLAIVCIILFIGTAIWVLMRRRTT